MKPVMSKRKDSKGRITGHVATVGPIQGEGPTGRDAVTNNEILVGAALDRLDRGTLIGQYKGHTYVVSPTIHGWTYWLDTFSSTTYGCDAGTDKDGAKYQAISHLAKTVWTLDDDDQAFVIGLPVTLQRELVEYFQWQRAYRKFRDMGQTDNQARQSIWQSAYQTA